MTVSKDLMLSILAMDAYNQGYGQGIKGVGTDIGPATFLTDSLDKDGPISDSQAVGFYAIAYTIGAGVDGIAPGTTVISYRGTDSSIFSFIFGGGDAGGSDVLNGYGVGGGSPDGPQAQDAIRFFQYVATKDDPSLAAGGADAGDWQSADLVLTGHSRGGSSLGWHVPQRV